MEFFDAHFYIMYFPEYLIHDYFLLEFKDISDFSKEITVFDVR